ncbi:hypothetical protein AB0M43_07120 [Longispora sp. NPDC051575]|uniref:hypothetical protein n=1 Tax=Longispora sp. NPDC051575 TaxID=3154943 RepID=UPI003432C8C0
MSLGDGVSGGDPMRAVNTSPEAVRAASERHRDRNSLVNRRTRHIPTWVFVAVLCAVVIVLAAINVI